MSLPRVADLNAGEWREHARFPNVYMKNLLTSEDNSFASINVVQVPSGGSIGFHRHAQQIETVWIIKGQAILTLGQTDIYLKDGQIIAIPFGLEHALRNEGPGVVELLTIFTPPLN